MRTLNDFIVRPPTLDRWTIQRSMAMLAPAWVCEVTITGWCDRRRRPLFQWTEVVTADEGDLKVSDVVHHFALVAEQDRPTTNAAFHRGLVGEHWDQPELPFS